MRTQISLRILNSTEGRFVTVVSRDGTKLNGKLVKSMTNRSKTFLYLRKASDNTLHMIRRADVVQINGELCNIKIEAASA